MNYGITDVASVLGVTTSAVRYFEKENLIAVEKDRSGHRSYDESDAFRLLSYMKYRSMNFPMKDIVTQFSGEENDWKKILQRETAARDHALERAAYYRSLADSIDDHIRGIGLIGELLGKYEFAKSPAVLFAQDEKDGWLSLDSGIQGELRQWVAGMPHVKLGFVRRDAGNSPFGFFVRREHGLAGTLPQEGLRVIGIPSFSALHTVIKAQENFPYEPLACFAETLSYASGRGLLTGDTAWGQILLVEVEKGQRLHPYVELWIPVS